MIKSYRWRRRFSGPVTLLEYKNTRISKNHLWKGSVISKAVGCRAATLPQIHPPRQFFLEDSSNTFSEVAWWDSLWQDLSFCRVPFNGRFHWWVEVDDKMRQNWCSFLHKSYYPLTAKIMALRYIVPNSRRCIRVIKLR